MVMQGNDFTPTKGRKPRTGQKKLKVKYRNGYEDRWEYTADQMRWTDTGHDWDIVGVKLA